METAIGSGLLDFDQRAGKILRMQEQHGLAVRADFRFAVAEHARARLDQLLARSDYIRHVVADVVDAAVRISFDEFRDRRGLAERLDELDLGIGQRGEYGDDAMLRQRYGGRNLGTEGGAVDSRGLLDIAHRDRDMIEPAQHDASSDA